MPCRVVLVQDDAASRSLWREMLTTEVRYFESEYDALMYGGVPITQVREAPRTGLSVRDSFGTQPPPIRMHASVSHIRIHWIFDCVDFFSQWKTFTWRIAAKMTLTPTMATKAKTL